MFQDLVHAGGGLHSLRATNILETLTVIDLWKAIIMIL
jgi:hypothetical protein